MLTILRCICVGWASEKVFALYCILTPKKHAMRGNSEISGKPSPLSHFPTDCGVIPRYAASVFCVIFSFCRKARNVSFMSIFMCFSPTVLYFIGIIFIFHDSSRAFTCQEPQCYLEAAKYNDSLHFRNNGQFLQEQLAKHSEMWYTILES